MVGGSANRESRKGKKVVQTLRQCECARAHNVGVSPNRLTHLVIVQDLLVQSSVLFFAKSVVRVVGLFVRIEVSDSQLLASRKIQGAAAFCEFPHANRVMLVQQIQALIYPTQVISLIIIRVAVDVVEDFKHTRERIIHKSPHKSVKKLVSPHRSAKKKHTVVKFNITFVEIERFLLFLVAKLVVAAQFVSFPSRDWFPNCRHFVRYSEKQCLYINAMIYWIWVAVGLILATIATYLYSYATPKKQEPKIHWSKNWVPTEEWKELREEYPEKVKSGEFDYMQRKDFDNEAQYITALREHLNEEDLRR